jgi:hypothetical protein
MRKIFMSILLSTAASSFAASGAHAKEVKISGLHSQAEIRAACQAVGGTSWGGGRYGCINDSKGTSITCTPGGECTGTVPGRVTNPGGLTVRGVLVGVAKPVNGGGGVTAGGILDAPGGFASQGPSAAGAPLAPRAPAAPPVIIR